MIFKTKIFKAINDFFMHTDNITIYLKLPTQWEKLSQKQLRYLFSLIAQGYSIDEVKAFCLFRWNKITIFHRYSVMRTKELLEENLGWQFCGIIADALDKKKFSQNH